MRCPEAKRLMQKALAGDASGAEQERLEEHLAACAACTREWQGMERLAEAVGQAAPAELSPERDLSAEVMAEVAASPAVRVSWEERVFGSRLAQAVAAVVFLAICAGMLVMTMPRLDVLAGAVTTMPMVPMP